MGFEAEEPTPQQVAQTRKELILDTELPIVACIARLAEEKGCGTFVQAAAQVLSAGHGLHFLLVGDGPMRQKLTAMARDLNLGASLRLTGWRNDVSSVIANSDFLVLPSRSEGAGMVIIEAMALAKPSIGTHVGGILEIIRDGETGLLVPPDDANALADAIMRLLEDRSLRNRLGTAAQRIHAVRFSNRAMMSRTAQAYLNCL
jgi:glycosyltransferase involved in cell wall biosynthesis